MVRRFIFLKPIRPYGSRMTRSSIAKYLNPWMTKRQAQQQRLAALRQRDGDHCRRCRRPLRFDLPSGHDLGPRIECIGAGANATPEELGDLCLTHRRCNADGADFTAEVQERVRRKNEAALLSKSRKRVGKAA